MLTDALPFCQLVKTMVDAGGIYPFFFRTGQDPVRFWVWNLEYLVTCNVQACFEDLEKSASMFNFTIYPN
jgi:hypothetical protein